MGQAEEEEHEVGVGRLLVKESELSMTPCSIRETKPWVADGTRKTVHAFVVYSLLTCTKISLNFLAHIRENLIIDDINYSL